jgi:hypothetical protein
MLTENEKKVLKAIFTSFDKYYSINQIAKLCSIAPNGAFKILKKFEGEEIVKKKEIGSLHSYYLDFDNEKTSAVLNLALMPKLEDRLKYRYDDLIPLKKIADIGIIFGSYISQKKEPNDLDILFVIKKNNFDKYKKESAVVFQTMPVKAHDILQTEKDIKENISKGDKVIIEILRTGIVLWGYDKLIEIAKDGYKK